jgi:ribonucleoside-diphosphate reductase alpha chain
VLHVDWLTAEEKLVFKTAYEIDQKVIVRMANARSPYIDQGTSLNLFFDADEDEAYISEVHKEAILSPYIKSLYYMRSMAGVTASKGECLACEG